MGPVPATATENISIQQATDGEAWQAFVDQHPHSTAYHRWGWKQVVERAFGWPTYFLTAAAHHQILGIVPIVHQSSRLFGSFMTSMPFINGGGILASDDAIEERLLQAAISVAQREGVPSLELRHRSDHRLGLRTKRHKVTVLKRVNRDTERMFAELDKKVRADVRRPMKSGLTSEHGGPELLDLFYPIFARNMRDLGTPVYGREFFHEILRAFPDATYITVVRHGGVAIASSLLMGYRDTIEAGWSSSLREYLPLKPNMLLYWQNLCLAAEKGYSIFDFGRSSIGSGTHRFKLQWGCEEIPLYWDYWLADGKELPEVNPDNPKYRLAIGIWQRLPLPVANRLGPRIVRCLP
jgi:FemAB-related protein (PEP-CTERM system-associated)